MAEVNLAEIKYGVDVGDCQIKFSAKFSGYTVIIEALCVTSLITFHRKSAIFEGNVHIAKALYHGPNMLRRGPQELWGTGKVSFYNIPAVIEHHGEKRSNSHPNGIRNG